MPTLQSQALVSALKVAGVNATLDLQIGVSHDLNRLLSPLAMQLVNGFLDQQLRGARPRRNIELSVHAMDGIHRPCGDRLWRHALQDLRDARARARHRSPATASTCRPTTRPAATRRYPVIYFMHGSLVDSKRPIVAGYVARVDAAIRSGVMPPAIVVMPQGLNQNRWMDSRDGTKPMESIIIKNLIPHIDATYRTIATREGRAIEGHSMGGFGALHNGFKNPDLFIAVTGNAPGGATLDMGTYDPELWTDRLVHDSLRQRSRLLHCECADDARGQERGEGAAASDSHHLRHGGRPVSGREVCAR